ncbi:MAG TPA: multicopper oxidase domain-containing protein, partial [Pirellulaceae bacterium]|nr:multicopper oxidase domain-containing protein [Pirellulaceae bacterium]
PPQPFAVTHPFHIHVNPFLVAKVSKWDGEKMVDVTKDEIGFPVWRDTLAMKQGYTYELLTRYADFAGAFVDHCHILDHEDSGMMELVKIIDPRPDANSDAANGPRQPQNRRRISAAIPPADGRPSVLLFVKGAYCSHCMSQLDAMAKQLAGADVSVSVISASTADDLLDFPALPFTLIADPELKLFREYGAFDGDSRHATIVLDEQRRELFKNIGDRPFMDARKVSAVLRESRQPNSNP